ncbi:MAG: 50S ribosomal protein L17 [Lentisphaerae bacterium GWF2_45_14]|nr:MAG: 50S ribosomal protein L17 [Lentisphaerae bacterium GWF2_45_14]
MRHRKHTFKIGRSGAHRRAMLANMVSSLIECGEIKTTLVKAKEARRLADKMITYGKKGDLHHRRLAISKLRDETAVKTLFDKVAPSFLERKGGYTRIIKTGTRVGDAADMCILQLVQDSTAPAKPAKKVKKVEKAQEPTVVETPAVVEASAEAKAE